MPDACSRDVLGAAQLTGALPKQLVLHGIQPASTSIGVELSAPVAGALERLVSAVQADLAAWDLMQVAPGTHRTQVPLAEAPACA